jgi:hypothetical protein
MRNPARISASDAVRREVLLHRQAGVCGLETADASRLDKQGEVLLCLTAKHARRNHAGNLRSGDIICDAETDKLWVVLLGEEAKQMVLDLVQIMAMLPAIVKPSTGDLWKLTSSLKSSQYHG